MNRHQPRVSLITPCYNGEKFINRFLDSLLEQDYANVEFIFINDGSEDNTETIFASYRPRFEAKGWKVDYIYQPNKGQAAAVNQGLKLFSGDYVFFPDADDIMYPRHISEKVAFMESHPEYGMAYCVVDAVNEKDIGRVLYKMDNSASVDNLFDNLLKRRNISVWGSVSNIIRSQCLLQAIPSRQIYEGRKAQNLQILLPVAHCCKIGMLHESLGKIVTREASHSRIRQSLQERREELADIYLNTLLALNDNIANKSRYITTVFKFFPDESELRQDMSLNIYLIRVIPFIKIKYKHNKINVYVLGIPLFSIRRDLMKG